MCERLSWFCIDSSSFATEGCSCGKNKLRLVANSLMSTNLKFLMVFIEGDIETNLHRAFVLCSNKN
jgi:hypothetical protein